MGATRCAGSLKGDADFIAGVGLCFMDVLASIKVSLSVGSAGYVREAA